MCRRTLFDFISCAIRTPAVSWYDRPGRKATPYTAKHIYNHKTQIHFRWLMDMVYHRKSAVVLFERHLLVPFVTHTLQISWYLSNGLSSGNRSVYVSIPVSLYVSLHIIDILETNKCDLHHHTLASKCYVSRLSLRIDATTHPDHCCTGRIMPQAEAR